MQESITLLDPPGSGLLQLERDRVTMQEKIQKIYDKKTKPTVWNSITKAEFLPTIYDVPVPPSFSSSPIIEGLEMDPSKKGDAKSQESKDKINSKTDAAKSKINGPMKRLTGYTKECFQYFARIITEKDRKYIFSTDRRNSKKNSKINRWLNEKNNEINSKQSDNVNLETNNKTRKEIKAEPTEPRTEKFETIENMEDDKAAVDMKEIEKAKEDAKEKAKKADKKLKSFFDQFFNQNTSLGPTEMDKHNGEILYGIIYEFFLLCFSFVVTYNIYYFSFIYKWDVKTAHYDPEQGFLFGGVFKTIVDDWLMRDIRYPMLFMGYLYSWLIPNFFRLIGVIKYPKLCFIIILLHTMVIAFTQGTNAAMSVDSLLGGSPMSLVLILNILSCISAFFNTSMTVENALAWFRFYGMTLTTMIANAIRFLIAFFGVFISQFMVYFFFIYTTSGFGLLWESQIVGIGDTIAEINNHIDGKSGTDKNYCKEEDNDSALWKFINEQIEPHFDKLFSYLCIIFVVVKVIVVGLTFIGFFAKIYLMIGIPVVTAIIFAIISLIINTFKNSDTNNNTVMVSSKDSMIEKTKAWVQEQSKNRKEGLTRLSNEANQMLSKAVGEPLRNIKNKLSDNVVTNTALGHNTFTILSPPDKKELQDLTKNLNDIMTNIDFTKDKDGKQAEEDVKNLIINNQSVYEIIQHILQTPDIQQHIANRIGKGKRMPDILQHMFHEILRNSGANPKVSELVSNILTYKMDYGNELKEEENKPEDTADPNEVVIDFEPEESASPPLRIEPPTINELQTGPEPERKESS